MAYFSELFAGYEFKFYVIAVTGCLVHSSTHPYCIRCGDHSSIKTAQMRSFVGYAGKPADDSPHPLYQGHHPARGEKGPRAVLSDAMYRLMRGFCVQA